MRSENNHIYWQKKDLDKKDLDAFLRKNLLKISLLTDKSIEITDGAREVLLARKNELSYQCLRLIAMSRLEDLIRYVIDVMPRDLKVVVVQEPVMVNAVNYLKREDLKDLLPELRQVLPKLETYPHQRLIENLLCIDPECWNLGRMHKETSHVIVRRNDCPHSLMLEIINRFPSLLETAWQDVVLQRMVKSKELKIVEGKHFAQTNPAPAAVDQKPYRQWDVTSRWNNT
jgi:hypothetical protein